MASIQETFEEYLQSDITKAIELVKGQVIDERDEYKAEFEGDRTIRPTQVGRRQDKKKSTVTKIGFSFQKIIVKSAMNFLFGNPTSFIFQDEQAGAAFREVWESNRMDTTIQNFTTQLKSETEAVLFFSVNDDKKIKIRLYKESEGDYAPLFDEYGDLIAFVWSFNDQKPEEDNNTMWVLMKDKTMIYNKGELGWNLLETKPNPVKKIPVVFMRQDFPEWWDVKELIDRYEMSFSKFCDTNDYFGAPTLVVKGEVKSVPEKDKQGKAISIPKNFDPQGRDATGDVSYLTWVHAPESTKTEWETTKELIYSLTSTPDISFDNLKGLAPASGYAMKMQFLAAELKAKESTGEFSLMLDRVINLIFAFMATYNSKRFDENRIKREIKFNSPIPSADEDIISLLSVTTNGAQILSQETAIGLNPLVKEVEEEMTRIKKEEANNLGDTYNATI